MTKVIPNYSAKFLSAVDSRLKEMLIKQIALNGGKLDLPSYWIPEWPIVHDMLANKDPRIEFIPETPHNPAGVRLKKSIFDKRKAIKAMLKE